jgi:hypothetical protein
LRIATRLFLFFWHLAVPAPGVSPVQIMPPLAGQNAQVIEVTAKKYEFNKSPIHVKQGTKVQLKITALDKTHGLKSNLYPDGSDAKGDPGLVFTSKEDCFEIEKGAPTVIEFAAHTSGTLLVPLLQALRTRTWRYEGPAGRRAVIARALPGYTG